MKFTQKYQRKGAETQRREEKQSPFHCGISLTPGFSPVLAAKTNHSRFNGLADLRRQLRRKSTVKTVLTFRHSRTRLKPGVNEILCVSASLR
jgi:hypothetical protein